MDAESELRDLGLSVIGATIYSVLSERSALPSIRDGATFGGYGIPNVLPLQIVILTTAIFVGLLALRRSLE